MSSATPPSASSTAAPWKTRLAYRWLGWYPPYWGTGISVAHVARDLSVIEVRMRQRLWNRNAVGTHFGGSLYSMCDPFFMLILLVRMGRKYIVWDKKASIQFLKPGRGTVRARFEISDAEVARLRELADRERVVEPTYTVDVMDEKGEIVARVEKLLYIRRKN